MTGKRITFKNKLAIPIIAIFITAVIIISANDYRLLSSSNREKTNLIIDTFTESVHMGIHHLTLPPGKDPSAPAAEAGAKETYALIQMYVEGNQLGPNGYGMVLHRGIIIAHPNKTRFGTDVSGEDWYKHINADNGFAWLDIDGVRYYAGFKTMNGHTVVGLIPLTEYHRAANIVLIETALFVSAASLAIILAVHFLMNKLLQPIKTITEGLGEIALGNFEARVGGDFTDEFALIKSAINEMAKSLHTYMNEKLQAERLAHEAELSRLDLLIKIHYDSLTSVYNRRYLDETLDQTIKLLSRSGGVLSVLMTDVDNFKLYNDTYGHGDGDACLRAVANALTGSIERETDFVARYGGEEFCIILPNTDEEGANRVAGRILANIRALKIKHASNTAAEYVTISIGVTTGAVTPTQSFADYVKRADEALYISKHNGRDQSVFLPVAGGS